jgi:hypothetical protein
MTLVDKINVNEYFEQSKNEPLLRILITRFTVLGQTSIGVSAYHTIGRFKVCDPGGNRLIHNYRRWTYPFALSKAPLSTLPGFTTVG